MKPNRKNKFAPNNQSWFSRALNRNGGGQQQQAPQQQQQQQQQQTQQSQQGGNNSQQQQQIDWNSFWAPPKEGNSKPQLMRQPFSVDHSKIAQVAQNQNFRMQVPQEMLQKILAGDANALGDVLNRFGQALYARTVGDTMGVVNSGFDQYTQSVEGYLPNMLQDHTFQQNLQGQFSQAKDPLFQGMFEQVANQLKSTNPNWTEDQIFGGVKEYFTKLGVNFDAKMQEQSAGQQDTNAATDWASFGGFETQAANPGGQSGNGDMGSNNMGGFSNSAAPV